MIAATLRVWPQALIEEALGEEAAAVLPEVIRLVELRARIPRYQRDMLRVLAEWQRTTADDVLTRELEGVASAYSSDLAGAVPDFRLAMRWPAPGAETTGWAEGYSEKEKRPDLSVPRSKAVKRTMLPL